MKQRLEWIDAMRGFTMMLVVANHFLWISCGEIDHNSSSMQFFLLFRMPLFFFISGFLSYRPNADWSFSGFRHMLGKKVRIQIIPTIVFFFAGAVLLHPKTFGDTVVTWFHSPTKGGYWFTLVLLYMFIVYYIYEYITNRITTKSQNHKITIFILWFLALCASETCYLPKVFDWANGHRPAYTGWLVDSSVLELMRFFHFFVFGNIIHRYWHKTERIFEKPGFYLAIVAIACVCTTEYIHLHLLHMQWANITHTLAQYSLLTLVFLFFRYYQQSFSKETRVGRSLQYIGTRTLDIYLLHYFFLPKLPEVGEFFNTHKGNFVLDTTLSFLAAIVIIGFCLVVSNALRISPFLKKYLFGREDKKPTRA